MPRCVGQSGQNQPCDSLGAGERGWKRLNTSAAKQPEQGATALPAASPKSACPGNGVGYCSSSLIRWLQIPSVRRRRCFVRSSAWDLVTTELSQPHGTCGAEGFSSRASYLPPGAGEANIFPCSADLPPSGRSSQVPEHKSPSRPSAARLQHKPSAEGQGGQRAAGITTMIRLFRREGCSPGPSCMKSISGGY